jgi:hypothetical protein
MLRFLEFLTLDEDTVPDNNIGDGNVDGYDPRMIFRKMLRRNTWLKRKDIKQRTKARITEAVKEYEEVRRQHYGARK